MKKIFFDTSIHLGQFCTSADEVRIACKNSQASISGKQGEQEIIGFITFNENSWSDHLIWGLQREPQDAFYRFMDPFHTLKQVNRIPLRNTDAIKALEIAEQFNLDMSNALTCAVTIAESADEIHSFYKELDQKEIKDYMKTSHGIILFRPEATNEISFPEQDLEEIYQNVLYTFRKYGIDLFSKIHT